MLTIRHATAAEMPALAAFVVDEPVGSVTAERFRAEMVAGRVRPEWTWLAEEGEQTVGRAVWWGRADSAQPVVLDCLHVVADLPDRVGVAAALLRHGHAAYQAAPELDLVLPTGWRTDPAVVAAVAWRVEAASAAGLTDTVERLRYEWTPTAGVPPATGRLTFRSGTDAEFLAAFRTISAGSLDVATRRDLSIMDADAQARADLDFYLGCPGERHRWRLAEVAGGLAGVAVPSATPYHRNAGYLGVVPALRGRGYVDDLLGEITRVHAAAGAERITATTDVSNTPMAAAFDRAGYAVTEVRLIVTAPPA